MIEFSSRRELYRKWDKKYWDYEFKSNNSIMRAAWELALSDELLERVKFLINRMRDLTKRRIHKEAIEKINYLKYELEAIFKSFLDGNLSKGEFLTLFRDFDKKLEELSK